MIRSITIGVPLQARPAGELMQRLGRFRQLVQDRTCERGLTPRTVRLTLPPPCMDADSEPGVLRALVESTHALADAAGARWTCLPLDLSVERAREALLEEAQALVVRDQRLFVNLMIADAQSIHVDAAAAAAGFVLRLGRRSVNGIDNFRVGLSAACPAGLPFFPFSRHEGEDLAFSIAMETTATALEFARRARQEKWKLVEFQERLIEAFARDMARVDALGCELEEISGLSYRGLDGSLAPFPDGKTSVAHLVELLGPTPVGAHGSVFITSVLTEAIKVAGGRAQARMVGFNGVMYSVLEDNGLTDANNLRSLSLEKLALLSTVCGCGIDMVPVPGTMFAEDLAGLVLDIATLAVRLRKPLGVRVLPVPRKAVNEYTELNLDFLCDSRVMDPGISASRPLLGGATWRYAGDRR
ncbi:MAG TPA: DUF711 family protein [Rubrivivax sp.]|nr:DUF711 family protein [Burkholderiales bacterium]HNT39648.1 DUF711 family protein [Rubrivivax sp.]